MEWWQILKNLSEERGISQNELARRIDRHYTYISKVFSGEIKNLTSEMEIAFARALDMSLGEFLTTMHRDQDVNIVDLVKVPVKGVIEKMVLTELKIAYPDVVNVPDSLLDNFISRQKELIAIEIKDNLMIDEGLRMNEFLVVLPGEIVEGRTHLVRLNGGQIVIRKLRRNKTEGTVLVAANGKVNYVKEEEIHIVGVMVARMFAQVYD
jgi:SOS-response transcriptional repressor LexA